MHHPEGENEYLIIIMLTQDGAEHAFVNYRYRQLFVLFASQKYRNRCMHTKMRSYAHLRFYRIIRNRLRENFAKGFANTKNFI
jgi:hypothetical protein